MSILSIKEYIKDEADKKMKPITFHEASKEKKRL